MILKIIIVVSIVLFFALAWWIVFRIAMRHPNNGNEFSVDREESP